MEYPGGTHKDEGPKPWPCTDPQPVVTKVVLKVSPGVTKVIPKVSHGMCAQALRLQGS